MQIGNVEMGCSVTNGHRYMSETKFLKDKIQMSGYSQTQPIFQDGGVHKSYVPLTMIE